MQCLTDLIFLLVAVESIFGTRSLPCCIVAFGSLSSRITKLPNFYGHVRFKIFDHLISRGYDFFQK